MLNHIQYVGSTGEEEFKVDREYIQAMHMLFSCYFDDGKNASKSGLVAAICEKDGSQAWLCNPTCSGSRPCHGIFLAEGRSCLKISVKYN